MLFEDTYRMLSQPSRGEFKDKGSKFYAYAFVVKTDSDIKEHLQELRKKHYDARHHAYAYILGVDKAGWRANDDGEPSGSSGKPIYGQLLSYDLTNTLIVVVRYFGGTKLGIPGLINAYRSAAKDAIEHANIIEKKIEDIYELTFTYPDMNNVMRILKDEGISPLMTDFQIDCRLQFKVRKQDSSRIYDKFKAIHTLKVTYIKTI
ncbi:MAG: YigZ family protein [Bacteroidales bacterium]|nr:YigZ family protein [Bacteroidales bacterium]